MKIRTAFTSHVEWHDFEQAVVEHYGQPFDFVADQECSNDVSITFSVSARPLSEYEQDELDKFKDGEGYYNLSDTLLDDMARQGLIPTGEYVVHVSW